MRDVGPPAEVALGQLDRVAEELGLALAPQLPDARHRQLPLLAPGGVHELLEAVHGDLPEHGRDRVLEVLGQQRQPRGRRVVLRQQPPEDDRLAEHRGRLGQRQRGGLVEDPLPGGEREVHAVAELVGERQHVAAAGGVVRAARRGTPTAWPPRRTHRRACPGARARRCGSRRRSARASRAELGREGAVAVEHDLARLRVGVRDLVLGDGRHAVVVGQPLHPQQAGLQPVPRARRSHSGPGPPRAAPARTRRWLRWRGCAPPASWGSGAGDRRPPCRPAAC